MGSDSSRHTVGDYVTLQRGTTYKGILVGKPGPALLGLGSIEPGGGFREGHYQTYGGECPPNLMLVPGDLYAALKGATKDGKMIGSVARVPSTVPSGRLTQDTVKLEFRDEESAKYADYIYWLLRTPQYREYCAGHAMGSAVVALSRLDFLSFTVPPATPMRLDLIATLESLESKIQLNRKTNETLEEMARALFQSWFVDFDPVRAKAEGRAPSGMDAATAALFPGEFVESEQGKIPKGWRCAPLSNWVATLSGGTPSKNDPSLWNGTLPWISPKVMTAIHADQAEAFVTASAIGNGTRLAPAGATLVMVRGMGLHQEVRVSQARRELTFNQDVKALVPEKIAPSLLLFAMLHAQRDLLGRVETSGHGTGKLPSEILLGQRLVMPPLAVQPLLAKPFDMLNDRIAVLRSESVQLTSLRDELLPRLLSGGLTVELERGSRAYERDS